MITKHSYTDCKDTAALENCHFLMKLDINLPYDLTISFLGICSIKMKMSTKKSLYVDIHSSFINNSQTL